MGFIFLQLKIKIGVFENDIVYQILIYVKGERNCNFIGRIGNNKDVVWLYQFWLDIYIFDLLVGRWWVINVMWCNWFRLLDE